MEISVKPDVVIQVRACGREINHPSGKSSSRRDHLRSEGQMANERQEFSLGGCLLVVPNETPAASARLSLPQEDSSSSGLSRF